MKTTYLTLLTFTDLGLRNIAQSPQRAAAWRRQAEAAGVIVVAQLWTTGAYDGVLILEGDSEEQILRALTQLDSGGNVRTHSLRALQAEDFERVIRS